MIRHIIIYCIDMNSSNIWSIGYWLVNIYINNGLLGIILTTHVTVDYYKCYISIYGLVNEIYYGYTIINIHSYSTSIIFISLYIHIIRNLLYLTYYYNYLLWINGLYLILMSYWLSYWGYIIPWCQLSIWGLIVISNVINICWLINYINGTNVSSNINNDWTIKRFYVYHLVLYLLLILFIAIHTIYLHTIGSHNILSIHINNYLYIYPTILINDILGYNLCGIIYSILIISCYQFTNTYNNIEVIELLITPLHICPEWYFLHLYMILKVIPSKCDGINYLVISVLINIMFSEYKLCCINIRIISYVNYYSNQVIIYIISSYIMIIVIGIQLINNIILSYGRIFIIIYLLLMSTLSSYTNVIYLYLYGLY